MSQCWFGGIARYFILNRIQSDENSEFKSYSKKKKKRHLSPITDLRGKLSVGEIWLCRNTHPFPAPTVSFTSPDDIMLMCSAFQLEASIFYPTIHLRNLPLWSSHTPVPCQPLLALVSPTQECPHNAPFNPNTTHSLGPSWSPPSSTVVFIWPLHHVSIFAFSKIYWGVLVWTTYLAVNLQLLSVFSLMIS